MRINIDQILSRQKTERQQGGSRESKRAQEESKKRAGNSRKRAGKSRQEQMRSGEVRQAKQWEVL